MSDFESDLPSDGEWDERGDLAWNEFDWEKYLRTQDEVLLIYLGYYERHKAEPDRIDRAADAMGWDRNLRDEDAEEDDVIDAEDVDDDLAPYTLHKNPVFIATRALGLSLRRGWELIASDGAKVPQRLALAWLTSLQRTEDHAMLGVQALDLGDYAMAISLYKRALAELNALFRLLSLIDDQAHRALLAYRDDARMRLFDLREIWLRVIHECREELEQPLGSDDLDEEQE